MNDLIIGSVVELMLAPLSKRAHKINQYEKKQRMEGFRLKRLLLMKSEENSFQKVNSREPKRVMDSLLPLEFFLN